MLDDDNKWYCNKCKDHVRATKQMDLYKAPPILVINLKRFKQSGGQSSRFFGMYGGGGYGQKIDAHVDFPLEGLDLTDFIMGDQDRDNTPIKDRIIYDCYAVSNHFGNMGFGHYTAFGRSPTDDQWYEFDDSRVSPVRNNDARR